MKFIHVADLHLDQSFEGLGQVPHTLSEKLVTKNQETLSELVDNALNEEVDFVLIVGDTFHQTHVTIQTQNFFIQQMERLAQKDILVVLSFGNHDYFEEHRFWFEFPKNVIVFENEQVGTVVLSTRQNKNVAISGFSYNTRWLDGSKLADYPLRRKDVDYHIGLYHGQIGEKKYGDFSPVKAQGKGYDYWALGHIHQPQVIAENPPMIYPGSLNKHTKKESDSGYYVLADYTNKSLALTWHTLGSIHWEKQTVATNQVETMQSLSELCLAATEYSVAGTQFLELELTQVSETLKKMCQDPAQKKELLQVLQQTIYQKTQHSVWLYALSLAPTIATETYMLPLRKSSVASLVDSYQELDTFQEIIGDLYKNATSAQLLQLTPEKIKKVVTQAKEQFNQSFSTKERDSK